MEIPTLDQLIDTIEAFCARHGMAPSRFGRDSVNDPALIANLREGRTNPGLAKLQRIAAFMAQRDSEAGQGDAAEAGRADHADSDTADARPAQPGNAGDITSGTQVAA